MKQDFQGLYLRDILVYTMCSFTEAFAQASLGSYDDLPLNFLDEKKII